MSIHLIKIFLKAKSRGAKGQSNIGTKEQK